MIPTRNLRKTGSRAGILLWGLWPFLLLDFFYLSYADGFSEKGFLFWACQGVGIFACLFLVSRRIDPLALGPGSKPVVPCRSIWFFLVMACGWRIVVPFWGHPWPTGDEALQAFLGIHLSQHWEWRYFYTVGQHPPLSVWICSSFLNCFPSVHFFFAGCAAAASILTLWVWVAATRRFLPKGAAWLFGILMVFSFWPVYAGEFYLQMVPLFEGMVLWTAGHWSRTRGVVGRRWMALAWGLATGLGFFTYSSWIVVAIASIMAFLWLLRKEKDGPSYFLFFAALGTAMTPFLVSAFREGFGRHLEDIALTNGVFSPEQKWMNLLSYWTALFGGVLVPNGSNGPVWGGFLNPILGVAFLRGSLGLWKGRHDLRAAGLLALMVWCMVPGLATADYPGFYRIVQVMPWIMAVAALGLWELSRELGSKTGRVVLPVLLALSVGLDTVHLVKANGLDTSLQPRPDTPTQTVNREAFRILRTKSLQEGPGLIFSDLLLLSRNHSLSVETYPFNAALNPRFDPAQAHWAALLVNRHLEGPLSKRFRKVQWIPLSGGTMEEDGGLSLGLVPVEGSQFASFEPWLVAHRFFHERQFEAENILNDPMLYQKACADLSLGYPLMKGDPFLESVYGEWVAQYHFAKGLDPNLAALHRALEKGYPTANLYLKYGNFLFLSGRKAEAMKAYSLAVQSRPNYTDAQAILDYLRNSR